MKKQKKQGAPTRIKTGNANWLSKNQIGQHLNDAHALLDFKCSISITIVLISFNYLLPQG
jgi:hypothetical protein